MPTEFKPGDGVMDMQAVAAYLGMHVATVRQLCSRDVDPLPCKITNEPSRARRNAKGKYLRRRFLRVEVDRWLANRQPDESPEQRRRAMRVVGR